MKKPLLAVMYYQQAKVEADCFNPEAFNDIWIQAAREEIIVYVEMNEITMAYHRCRVACKRVMNFDTGALTPENTKVLRADFLKLLKGVKQYRDNQLRSASKRQRLHMENMLRKFDEEHESGITRRHSGMYGAIDLASGYDSKSSYREKRRLNRMLMETFTKKAVRMQLKANRKQKKLDQKYGKNRQKLGEFIIL